MTIPDMQGKVTQTFFCQIVKMSKSDRKLSAFSELLDSYVQAGTGDKLIAWTEDAEEAMEMYKVSM